MSHAQTAARIAKDEMAAINQRAETVSRAEEEPDAPADFFAGAEDAVRGVWGPLFLLGVGLLICVMLQDGTLVS